MDLYDNMFQSGIKMTFPFLLSLYLALMHGIYSSSVLFAILLPSLHIIKGGVYPSHSTQSWRGKDLEQEVEPGWACYLRGILVINPFSWRKAGSLLLFFWQNAVINAVGFDPSTTLGVSLAATKRVLLTGYIS